MTAALRAALVLVGILCIGAFHPLQDSFKRQVPPGDALNPFKDLFKRGKSREQDSQSGCTRVSADLIALMDYQNSVYPYFNNYVSFMTSVDVSNITAVDEVVCHFVADSTGDFVSFLRYSGIERSVTRRLYDYAMVSLRLAILYGYFGSDSSENNIHMFFQNGFSDLDPVGVDEMAAIIQLEISEMPDINSVQILERDSPATCADFLAFFDKSHTQYQMGSPYSMLLPFLSPTQVQDMICDILCELSLLVMLIAALAKSIDQIQDVLDANRFFEGLLDFGKMQLSDLRYALPHMELQAEQVADPDIWSSRNQRINFLKHAVKLLRSLEAARAL
ncbi:hypothetical protein CAPTEDRAFT_207508 [Capitella teleta]|uniref:Uncharacterized protein n=1 Tax=Capitella teleta TaxID=283909 RepID=R7U2S2_CAPTE|nr:hypothetical protein CAPTEDRAFT_207508 [Capitella teleta]|eukprot:ELU00645.1 hypothetical protein CAPTEDRAFT_207508 [Capitella teleta]